MTLVELAPQYRAQAALLGQRIGELRALLKTCEDENVRFSLTRRIQALTTLRRESREIAALLEHYYERGYYRNAKYTLQR